VVVLTYCFFPFSGDILRATGNLAGRSANLVFKRVGQGIGDGVSNLTNTIGDGIEDATGKIGARKVGAGVNSVLSGVGDGVGKTFTGGKALLRQIKTTVLIEH
jgi:hypothetical protein